MVSIIFLGMSCNAINENHIYNCVPMLYSYPSQEEPGCLIQQYGSCLAAAELPNRALSVMLEPSAPRRPGLPSHYGANVRGLPANQYPESLRIPTEPWVTGDTPEPGRVHIRIFVSGAEMKDNRFGSSLMNSELLTSTRALGPPNDTTGGELPYARWEIERNMPCLSLHHAGTHPLDDFSAKPQGKNRYVKGSRAFSKCDGNSELWRHLFLHADDEDNLRHVLEAAVRLLLGVVRGAKAKEPRYLDARNRTRPIYVGDLNIMCKIGRHRSTRVTKELQRIARMIGATCSIHYVHLWRGAESIHSWVLPDDRGPCGCHVGMCQNAAYLEPWLQEKLQRAEAECFRENELRVDFLLRNIKDEIDSTEGLVIDLTPPQPKPPAPQAVIAKVPPPMFTPAKVMPKGKTPSLQPALPPLAPGSWIEESELRGVVRGQRRYCGPNYTYCEEKPGRAQGMHPYECFSCCKDLRKGEAKSGPTPIQP